MTNVWTTKALADVCQIKPPKAEIRSRISHTELVSFVPMEDLGIGKKTFVPTQTRPLAEVNGSYTYFANGDVLLAKITPCFENGKLGIAENLTNGVGFGSSEYIVFRPSRLIDKDWLYYFLSREAFRKEGASRMSGAVGHKRVAKEFIEAYPIPVPPLPEQKRIVAILDEVFEGIATAAANAEKNLANARELFESYLNSVLTRKGQGWVEKRLEEIGHLQTGTTPKTADKSNLGTYIPFIKPGDFRIDGSLNYDNEGLSEVGLKQSRLIRSGSAVMVCIGATIGKAGFVGRDVSANQQVNAITPNEGVSGKFLYYHMISEIFQNEVVANSAQATLPIINKTKWGGLVVSLPKSLVEQERIVSKLDDLSIGVQQIEDVYVRKVAALSELKQSILQKAFAGELTAQSDKALREAAE